MLDENLPAFFLKPSSTGSKHQRDVFLSHHGCDPAPSYRLQNADPAAQSLANNCYGAALFDAYSPEILFGESLARPSWTQPTLSAEELRKHNGVPPPPQPILPNEFVIQLYNPDQQVRVETKEGKWGSSDSYDFSMPQSTFRVPSASNLDRGQGDPASLAITPKIHFVWRKESKLSKDLTCFMTGRSTDTHEKKKSKRDPDIAIALWRNLRELTIYEPNMLRLDLEDPKGLEVVLLLSAVLIKDVYFASKDHIRELFNISDTAVERKLSGRGRKLSNAQHTVSIVGMPNPLGHHPMQQQQTSPPLHPTRNDMKRHSLPRLQTTPPQASSAGRQPPPMADPRSQWDLDAETTRLKAQAEAEAKEERRRRREREKADEMERKRLQKMVEEEEKAARRKQTDIDKETERLRKQYGVQPIPNMLPRPQPNRSQPNRSQPRQRPAPGVNLAPPRPQPPRGSNGVYGQPSASSSAIMMSGANPSASTLTVAKPTKKKSFFGLRSASDDGEERKKLNKR